MSERYKSSLVLADVDGTLVTQQKILTQRAQSAVRALRVAGIQFAITSGRPPRGMTMLVAPLALDTPIAGFNGGLFVKPDLTILQERTLPGDVARQALHLLRDDGLDAWVYCGNDWLITKPDAPHVARETSTVNFQPIVVADFKDRLDRVAKIVGVSDDLERVKRCASRARAAFGIHATSNQSQPYYLDITNRDANKGAVVDYLSAQLHIPFDEIVTIGDQANDMLMFKKSGMSIAMGNAPDEVKAAATAVTASYNDEGFAKAMEHFVLGEDR